MNKNCEKIKTEISKTNKAFGNGISTLLFSTKKIRNKNLSSDNAISLTFKENSSAKHQNPSDIEQNPSANKQILSETVIFTA